MSCGNDKKNEKDDGSVYVNTISISPVNETSPTKSSKPSCESAAAPTTAPSVPPEKEKEKPAASDTGKTNTSVTDSSKAESKSQIKSRIENIVNRLLKYPDDPFRCHLGYDEANEIAIRSRECLMNDGAMTEVDAPMIVVGDLHGQFADCVSIFEQNGFPPKSRYLYLGDYVDRGDYSTETVTLLLGMKILYPDCIYLLRGNHETRVINRVYGFLDEILTRFKMELWEQFQMTFNCLPICARINKRILCMHGGVSRELTTWNMMNDIKRPIEIPTYGLLCDLLWADPTYEKVLFGQSVRGISATFGESFIVDFCKELGLDLILRGHQVVMDGYEFFAGRRLMTIFSAPHYCKEYHNSGAVLIISKDLECKMTVRKPENLLQNEGEEPELIDGEVETKITLKDVEGAEEEKSDPAVKKTKDSVKPEKEDKDPAKKAKKDDKKEEEPPKSPLKPVPVAMLPASAPQPASPNKDKDGTRKKSPTPSSNKTSSTKTNSAASQSTKSPMSDQSPRKCFPEEDENEGAKHKPPPSSAAGSMASHSSSEDSKKDKDKKHSNEATSSASSCSREKVRSKEHTAHKDKDRDKEKTKSAAPQTPAPAAVKQPVKAASPQQRSVLKPVATSVAPTTSQAVKKKQNASAESTKKPGSTFASSSAPSVSVKKKTVKPRQKISTGTTQDVQDSSVMVDFGSQMAPPSVPGTGSVSQATKHTVADLGQSKTAKKKKTSDEKRDAVKNRALTPFPKSPSNKPPTTGAAGTAPKPPSPQRKTK